MAKSTLSPLQRQVSRVSRRLFLRTFFVFLLWSWAVALVLSAGWFLAQAFLWENLQDWQRLAVAEGLFFLATVAAVVLAIVRAPSKISAALLLDERFGLKERATTSMTLAPELETSPAAQALLADVNQRVEKLDIGSRFPVGVPWSITLAPACAAILAIAAFYYQPPPSEANTSPEKDLKQPAANAKEIENKINQLKKKVSEKQKGRKEVSEELKRLDAELDQILNRPRQTKEQLRERVPEMAALEEAMKNREKELADKIKALKQQLQQMDKMAGNDSQEGPAKDLQDALAKGNLDKAKEEIEKLSKKLKENKLTDEEKEQLGNQLKQLKEKLERVAKQENKEKQLKQLAKEGKLDAETLKRELDQLKKDKEKLKDLQELANKLGQCQKCMQKGDGKGAMENLKGAAAKLKDLDLEEKDLDALQEQLQRLEDAKESMCQGCQGDPQDSGPGDQPIPAMGRRPRGEKSATSSFDARARGEFDPKGKKIFDGYAPGQNFKKKTAAEMAGEVHQAATQDAPEAIEQQRIPKAAKDIAKEYFRKLAGQEDKEKK